MLGRLIEKTITGPAYDLEASVKVDIMLMGSFQYTSEANDIDLVFVYRNADYDNVKKLKDILATAVFETFKIPVHYTTLSRDEYEQMMELQQEKHLVLFESSTTN